MLSIVVCTRNQCAQLKDTLEALKHQTVSPSVEMEILVVDNDSQDKTRGMVLEMAEKSPLPIRYLFEPQPDFATARSRGIDAARGSIIALSHDDIIPASHWAESICSAFTKYRADVIGGPILPIWSSTPPEWMQTSKLQEHLTVLNRGSTALFAQDPRTDFISGANMAFKKNVFLELNVQGMARFDSGVEELEISDAEVIRRLIEAGRKVVYEPTAVVYHRIDRQRLQLGYLRRNLFSAGKAYAKFSGKWDKIPLWLIRECVGHALQAVWCYCHRTRVSAVEAEREFWYRLGMIAELQRAA